jgi:hypothetical protein
MLTNPHAVLLTRLRRFIGTSPHSLTTQKYSVYVILTGFVHVRKSQIQGFLRTFKAKYQQIQGLNIYTEEKELEISKM